MGAGERDPGTGARAPAGEGLSGRVATRVEEIVAAAEHEAAVVAQEMEQRCQAAEQDAVDYLAHAQREADAMIEQRYGRVRDAADDLMQRAEEMGAEFERVLEALRHARAELQAPPERIPEMPLPPPPRRPLPSPPAPPEPPSRAVRPHPAAAAEHDDLAGLPPKLRRASFPSGVSRRARPAPPPADEALDDPADEADIMPPSRAELRATRRARRAERVSVRDAGAREAADPAARRARSGAQDLDPAQLDAARMVAIEMAASGRTREQVDAHLRDAFHIGTTQPVLDDVFGAQGSRRRRSPFAGG